MGRFPSTTPKLFTAGPFGNADPVGSKEFTIFYTEYNPIEVVYAAIMNDAAISANATNYVEFILESGASETGSTVLFSVNTSAGAVVAGKLTALAETEGTVAVNQYLTFTATEGGDSRITDCMLLFWYVEGTPASE